MNVNPFNVSLLPLVFLLLPLFGVAQEASLPGFTNEQSGSIYYAYPAPPASYTPAPEGYAPFYVSHYGRHGSRWITSDERYTDVLAVFDSHNLTPLGKEVRQRLQLVWEDARGRSGDLTPLGIRQHKAIAARLYRHYPEVFRGKAAVCARSSTSVRCILSMAAFTEGLKEQNPSLDITREASRRYMDYLAYTSPEAKAWGSEEAAWRKDFHAFEASHIRPQRLMASLFTCPDSIRHPQEVMMGLYWIASDMQNVELPLSFYDLFLREELEGIWKCINYRMYLCNAAAPLNEGIPLRSAASLLRNIIDSADEAIRSHTPAATLRFGHDTNLIRLLALMQIESCCNRETDPERFHLAWQDFRISPMAANLQLIFFHNSAGDILVKFLLNETEVTLPLPSPYPPYYKWEEVKALYSSVL